MNPVNCPLCRFVLLEELATLLDKTMVKCDRCGDIFEIDKDGNIDRPLPIPGVQYATMRGGERGGYGSVPGRVR